MIIRRLSGRHGHQGRFTVKDQGRVYEVDGWPSFGTSCSCDVYATDGACDHGTVIRQLIVDEYKAVAT